MKISYAPILKALPSEITALGELDPKIFNELCPLIDFPLGLNPEVQKIPKKYHNSTALIEDQLVEKCEKIAKIFKDKLLMVDNYRWQPDSQIETGELVISKIANNLIDNNVNVIPVIGYDRWDNAQYRQFYKTMHFTKAPFYCLRLDKTAFEESSDLVHFYSVISEILSDLVLQPKNVMILIDIGSVFSLSEDELLDRTENIIQFLMKKGFTQFITSGCSLPATIDKAAPKDQTNILARKEMICWQYLRRSYTNLNIIYGDYGVRPAESAEGPKFGGNANAKIRYTIDKAFYIVRGHMVGGQKKVKEKQNWGLARKVVESKYYMGEHYSFGDYRIKLCSEKKFNGTHGHWIENDTTHHITFCMDEVSSFEVSIGLRDFEKTTTL